jgi:hydrogenase nickel incorporation protein HypA/HybF
MHELSIAQSLIELVEETAAQAGAARVKTLTIQIGALAGVVKESLWFSFELAAEGTCCAGAKLQINVIPVSIFCDRCEQASQLNDVYVQICPRCGMPAAKILTGLELDLVSLELEPHATAHS